MPRIRTNDFLPQSGTLIDWRPASGEGVRIDHGLDLPGGSGQPVLRSDAGQGDCPWRDPRGGAAAADRRARRHGCARVDHQPQLSSSPCCGIRHSPPAKRPRLSSIGISAREARRCARSEPDARTLALAAVLLFEAHARDGQQPLRAQLDTGRRPALPSGRCGWRSATPIMPSASRPPERMRYVVALGSETRSRF